MAAERASWALLDSNNQQRRIAVVPLLMSRSAHGALRSYFHALEVVYVPGRTIWFKKMYYAHARVFKQEGSIYIMVCHKEK